MTDFHEEIQKMTPRKKPNRKYESSSKLFYSKGYSRGKKLPREITEVDTNSVSEASKDLLSPGNI